MALKSEPDKDGKGLKENPSDAGGNGGPGNAGRAGKKNLRQIENKGSEIEAARHFEEQELKGRDCHYDLFL